MNSRKKATYHAGAKSRFMSICLLRFQMYCAITTCLLQWCTYITCIKHK